MFPVFVSTHLQAESLHVGFGGGVLNMGVNQYSAI